MLKFCGKGVFGAIAIGKISVFKKEETQICRREILDFDGELKRLEESKRTAVLQLEELYKKALRELGEQDARIFETHIMMLEDEDYNESVKNVIKTRGVNAEYAVSVTSESFSKVFSEMDDSYMQARAADVRDISERLIYCLGGKSQSLKTTEKNTVMCAVDFAPGETLTFDKEKVIAFVTSRGSSNSHTAILARNMNIPAVIGVGEEFLSAVKDGDIAAVDGFSGEVFVNPDEKTTELILKKQKEDIENKQLLQKLRGKENVTLDGKKINVFANAESLNGVEEAVLNDAGGIGLFRSEFLYLENGNYPDEQLQFATYKRALECMGNKKVIIRTMDIGADKQAEYFGLEKEENPALGFRAIRICLERPEIFTVQLRALFRASVYGNLGIMFPLIANEWELEKIIEICDEVKNQLKAEKTEYNEKTEIGIMIETPAAALISEKLAPKVDFFSVGTNDLTQYTLACDRQNPLLEKFCNPRHEAILKLIELAATNAHKNGAWIGICGELAADTSLTERFLRMGIDELSVSPGYILKVREAVRKSRFMN